MGNSMLLPPFFATGVADRLEKFIESDIFKNSERIWYYFESDTGYLVRIGLDGTYSYVKGYNKSLVQRYISLPSTAVGDREVLYIVGDTVYTFDGDNYVPTYKDLTDVVNELSGRVSQNTQAIQENATAISGLQTSVSAMQSELATKASATDLQALSEVVATKADETDLQNLSGVVATKADETDLQNLSEVVANKANTADVYSKSESYSKNEIDAKIGTPEGGVTIVESIAISKEEAVDEAKSYVDQQIAFNIV